MKLPAFQFYPGDWRKDPGVQSLGYEARGVWFEILCLMHESDRRGVLLLNGKAMTDEALARLLGLAPDFLETILAMIDDHGVSSRDPETGALMCRRMVRDEQTRDLKREAGKLGGNPKLCKEYDKPGFVYAVRRESDGAVKIGIATNVENRLRKLRYSAKGDTLTLKGQVAVPNMGAEEERLHKQYAPYCIGGEWFKLPVEITEPLKVQDMGQLMGNQGSSSSVSASANTTHTQRAGADEPEVEDSEPPGFEPPLKAWIAECARYSIPEWYAKTRWENFSAKGWHSGRTPLRWRRLMPLVKRDFVNDGSPMTERAAAPAPPKPAEDFKADWPAWLKSKGHKAMEYDLAPEGLKSEFWRERKAKKS